MEKLIESFSFGLFFWQIAIFVGLVLLLRKYAWGPILKAVNDREEGIKQALESAENARKEMQNLQADNEKLLKQARAERDAMMKEAREVKDKMIADAKEQAQAEANKIIVSAQASIQSEKQAAINDLKNKVAELSIEIAEKVVREELSAKDKQLKLVEGMLEDVKLN
ncbi:F0F1 ATP synthase subunit B [Robertkochia marina]|uniref:ATP synthase subunit b n=1 Tax=Robertkochia marina TaxID=1227945 RepID=A0A4S3M2R0_9FLAO|nr:F0F1 ATP synthase subunit B [Robertkochia marina]THD69356.1 F0F1 ATP synthase subunit B [Robertkochia marina]TRZ47383.1 F0F1 ATP synthase subunit B [Robertkochia marina]